MEILQAVVLGTVQGGTEFLPVSSSGHLVILQHLFGLTESHIGFDIAVHVGTLVAVIAFFFRDIRSLVVTLVRCVMPAAKRKWSDLPALTHPDIKLAALVMIGSIPTAVIGLLFHRISDVLFSSVNLVGMMLIITGLLLILTRWVKKNQKSFHAFTFKDALIIGLVQGMAILPGISRSGATIATAIFLGIRKEIAVEFSFLLSIPAIFGAGMIMVKDMAGDSALWDAKIMFTGMLASCVVGYFSLSMLVFIIKKGRLHFFAPYCWILGAAACIIN